MRILVVGAGMYVTGRDNTGYGVVLASLAQISKYLDISQVVIAAKKPENKKVVAMASQRINSATGSNLKVSYRPVSGNAKQQLASLLSQRSFDCAIVSIPDHLHYAHTKVLLENNVHCLVVKPFTPTLAEATELYTLQSQNNLYGAVEFHKRFDESNLYVKKVLTNHLLGKILYFTVDYSQRINIPKTIFTKWSEKTNVFQYLGVHYVDMVYFLTGFVPYQAMAIGTDGVLKDNGINAFDSIHATVLWRNPGNDKDTFVTQFATNWIDPNCSSAISDQKYKIIGTKGRIELDQKNRGLELVHEQLGIQHSNPYFAEYLPDPDGALRFQGYGFKSIKQFVEDVQKIRTKKVSPKDLQEHRPSFFQALVSSAVVDAVNASLENDNGWVEIDEIS